MLKMCNWHFGKWQLHPLTTDGAIYKWHFESNISYILLCGTVDYNIILLSDHDMENNSTLSARGPSLDVIIWRLKTIPHWKN